MLVEFHIYQAMVSIETKPIRVIDIKHIVTLYRKLLQRRRQNPRRNQPSICNQQHARRSDRRWWTFKCIENALLTVTDDRISQVLEHVTTINFQVIYRKFVHIQVS